MSQRKGNFQLLNKTQRLSVLGKLTKSKKFRHKKYRSDLYHPNPSKVKNEIKKIIEDFIENFPTVYSDLSLLRELWDNKESVDKMYEVLADFYLTRIISDWKFMDILHQKRIELSKILQQPNTLSFEDFTKVGSNQEKIQKLIQKWINDTKMKDDLAWLLKLNNEEYLSFVDRLVREGFLAEWELEQAGYTKVKISKVFRILTDRGITTNPAEKVWELIERKHITPFRVKRQNYKMVVPVFGKDKVWIFTPYGSRFVIILQSERIKQAMLKTQESNKE